MFFLTGSVEKSYHKKSRRYRHAARRTPSWLSQRSSTRRRFRPLPLPSRRSPPLVRWRRTFTKGQYASSRRTDRTRQLRTPRVITEPRDQIRPENNFACERHDHPRIRIRPRDVIGRHVDRRARVLFAMRLNNNWRWLRSRSSLWTYFSSKDNEQRGLLMPKWLRSRIEQPEEPCSRSIPVLYLGR